MDNWGQGTFTLFVPRLYRRAVTVAHQIDLLVHAFQGLEAGVRVFLAKYPFQSFQSHISKDGTDDTSLRRTIFRRIEDGFVHVSCFQPCIEDGFLHRNMAQQPRMADFVKARFDIPYGQKTRTWLDSSVYDAAMA